MPLLGYHSHGIPAVGAFGTLLDALLQQAEAVKPTAAIEPALEKTDFKDLQGRLTDVLSHEYMLDKSEGVDEKKSQRYAIIETAARDGLSSLIATTSIESPDFAKVWNLFDILSILSDGGYCDPALVFWLVEELLDSQTIAGCRIVFDFLESRRERITAKKSQQQNLVILRTCNELLRRLSRAEDTAFCGRVFIFLYQSFPLGDRSSVNLRGEYHVENVTAYDESLSNGDDHTDKMDLDVQPDGSGNSPDENGATKSAVNDKRYLAPEKLYPIFWSLQFYLNQPKKLFEPECLAAFKKGVEATMATFRFHTPENAVGSGTSGEDIKRNVKRKRDEDKDDSADAFNPKYLTSPDLFELEISDITFQRHVLVQVVIILDFLRSLSAQAKAKLDPIKATNKAVMYSDQALSDENVKWAVSMRGAILLYIHNRTPQGSYFNRMVDAISSRDKNWVQWKVENCPPIEKSPVSAAHFREAKAAALKASTNKRLRPTPIGSLHLGFLSNGSDDSAMDKFKVAERHELPDLLSFKRKIADDDFEIDMPTNNQTKAAAVEGKASKSWRALRIAGKYKLTSFDKIDNPDKIDVVFEDDAEVEAETTAKVEIPLEAAILPSDRRPVILCNSTGISGSRLINMLLEQKAGAFAKVPTHIVRQAVDGETDGRDYHSVDIGTFNMMRDGDQFLEYTDGGSIHQGTSRRLFDTARESGMVPVLEMDRDRAQQVKDAHYTARFVHVKSPSHGHTAEEPVNEPAAQTDLVSDDFFDLVVVINDDLDQTYQTLISFLYYLQDGGEPSQRDMAMDASSTDKPMEDVGPIEQINGA